MSAGDYGTSWAVDDFVTLSGRTNLGLLPFLPNGLTGRVNLAGGDLGVGVKHGFWGGSNALNTGSLGRECLDINLSRLTKAEDISVGLNKYSNSDDVFVFLKGGSRSMMISDQSLIDRAFSSTGFQQGVLDLGLIADAVDFGKVNLVSVQAGRGSFYVNRFATRPGTPGGDGDPTSPVPEPASLVLLGTGLLGMMGARKMRRSRS